MPKKKTVFQIEEDLNDIFAPGVAVGRPEDRPKESAKPQPESISIVRALAIISQQMTVSGYRERTISDYQIHVNHFANTCGLQFVDEIDSDSIYEWLASMNVSNQTKLTRLKCLKAYLSRCMDNGWIAVKFWRSINVRVDSNVKEGAAEREVNLLLSMLDLSDFVQLRDATATLLMYKTGIRINTLSQLEVKHIDFDAQRLRLDGDIMKNHKQLYLPFGDDLRKMLTVLIRQNEKIRREYGVKNDFVFVTKKGTEISTSPTHNNIAKRLNKYAKEYGLKNINPHALRRGFAKSLLDKGANIAVISNALGHSDIGVTSRYLHLDKEEVAENLRKYL